MVAREQGRGQDTLLWSDGAMAPEYPSGYPDTLFMRREMDKSSVRNELFDKAKEVLEMVDTLEQDEDVQRVFTNLG